MTVRVQKAAFDIGAELASFGQGAGVGGIATFSGIVRDLPGGGLKAMEIEHYPGMTERAIAQIVAKATARWELLDCLVIHRFGRLAPGAPIMMVATAAAHRAEAFAAAEFLMDYLKSRAPFWKKEITEAGTEWVAAKDEDEAALDRW
ncbi:molybdenum cofactor biosynthesis protein MoaE [Defluviimonas sp. 20V17]|uniref:Molybdopterin synthase catalytic subunit n=1 Tax=Allgaiera indica TaxID=765699 RepID=A0AAN4UNE7_9RHOB|nr:molybdenum cofactor biosynthesis protein MoaE [Allgaiera indica]KDB05257.1 molybdenum cofactor biosynthesis protein MoaE [Defluviimonas sp. 20V17]GHD99010.1 molybdopterin synthase catalytic subunit [Allgaiera indica]SDW01945.1 molybdopterin synthase subunit MoaE [Allgaiera indica]